MMMILARRFYLFVIVCSVLGPDRTALAEGEMISLGSGKVQLSAPEGWKVEQPRSRIVEAELSIAAEEGDEQGGRVTIMSAGGTVEQNVERWIGQFTPSQGKTMKESVNRDTKKVAGVDVTIVDISGTFKDQPRGPFGPSVDRKDYRMLAAIIPTANSGNYYVKVTGPAKTIAANNEKFVKFIESLQLK